MSDAYEIQCHRLRDELREARAEAEAQARLVGMGAERECALHCKIDIAENYAKKVEAERDAAIRELGKTARDLGHLQARADRMAELLRQVQAVVRENCPYSHAGTTFMPKALMDPIDAELAAHAKAKGEA